MKILDSDVIIDFLNEMPDAVARMKSITSEEEAATTVFNEQEVMYGALKSRKRGVILATRQFFNSVKVLAYDRDCIDKTLEIEIGLEKKGMPIGTMDEFIAGICLFHNAAIVTRNVEHFSRIPKLKIDKW
jgi:predicted nucleic acid-binding protein